MHHDILVIGGGSAGLSTAIFAAELGLDTALVEQAEEDIGGECLRTGCVPSKTLLRVAQTVYDAEQLEEVGLRLRGRVDWQMVKDLIRRVQSDISEHEHDALGERDITTYFGEATFTDRTTIDVDGDEVSADNIVLATGTSPHHPSVPGVEDAPTITNESIFTLDELPKELLVVGGGPLGCEIGQAMNRLGVSVTIIERGNYLLGGEPVEASKRVRKSFEDEGITVVCDADLTRFDGTTAYVTTNDGETTYTYDKVLLATGRTPNTTGLQLGNAGIACDETGYPEHDEYLQTTNQHVYVAGDLTGSYQFSHAAEHEASTIVKNLVLPFSSRISYDHMSHITYTDPGVASFGSSRQDLDRNGVRYETIPVDIAEADKAVINSDEGWGEYYVTGRTFRGGVVVSEDAQHIVQDLILAQSADVKTTEFVQKIYPYPTIESISKQSVLKHLQRWIGSMTQRLIRFSYRYL